MLPAPTVTHRAEKLDPLVIHQPDDRRIYNDPNCPWVCVCRITRPDGRRGSGVLIGARHVLTASHVVQWNTSVAERIEVHFGNSVIRQRMTLLRVHGFVMSHGLAND